MDFLVTISFDLIIFVIIFHFLLELMGTHYHHPVRQLILRYTRPLLDPLHKIFPNYRNIDLGLLFLLFLLENIKLLLLLLLTWQFPNLALLFLWSIFLLINTFINFYFFAVLFRLLISWVIPIYSNHPATQLLFLFTEPLLKPIRRRLPTIKGFDWTPIIVIIGLKILTMLVTYTLMLLNAPAIIL
ncbi:MAG: YggT family protein [Gammaproteobacteria bacterium]|nr:YggT family protein [Gammaproteobacteria bacterium]